MSALKRGVFWVTDIENAVLIIAAAECDTEGRFIMPPAPEMLADSGCEFNHKRVWEALGRHESFNFYPRGRVQIRRGKAVIYCNPTLCTQRIIDKVTTAFGLCTGNGISSVRVVADGSEHYKYFVNFNYFH